MFIAMALGLLAVILGFLASFSGFRAQQSKGVHDSNERKSHRGEGNFKTKVKSHFMFLVWSAIALIAGIGTLASGLVAFDFYQKAKVTNQVQQDPSAPVPGQVPDSTIVLKSEQETPPVQAANEQANPTPGQESEPTTAQSAKDASDSNETEQISAQVDNATIVPSEAGDGFAFKSKSGQNFFVNSKTTEKGAAALLILKSKNSNAEICLTVNPVGNGFFEVEKALLGPCVKG